MRENEPLISVIVPVYKVEQYLDRCVTSLVNQTYKNLEIILVDDGSPDGCPQMCDAWAKKDDRIKVIHKENGGVSSARNIGVAQCRGDFVGFVDSDDWIDEEMFGHLYYLLDTNNADISSVEYLKAQKENISPRSCKEKIETLDDVTYLKRFFKIGSQKTIYYVWNKLYRRALIPCDPFPVSYSVGEDVIATYLMIKNANRIVSSDREMYYYRNGSGVTADFNENLFRLTSVWDDVCKIAKGDGDIFYDYAIINRKRISLTILSELALSGEYKNYAKEVDGLIVDLKRNKRDLFKADIAKSRKFLVFLFCLDYRFFAWFINMIKRSKT